jgi:hypothetical protein
MPSMNVAATSLNLRSQPRVAPGNIVASLDLGHPVRTTGGVEGDGFQPLTTEMNSRTLSGFASAAHLRATASPAKEALIHEAVAQWTHFKRGTGKENVDPFAGFVGEMWSSIGLDLDGRDRDQPWSAAFISFVVRRAGYAGFKFAAAHARYIHDSIIKRERNEASPFWGFRITEHKPSLGDMVCRWRVVPRTFDDAVRRDDFKSHSDIVVQVGEGFVNTIGGNVAQSVSTTRYRLDSAGFLDGSGNVFAVLRNNL